MAGNQVRQGPWANATAEREDAAQQQLDHMATQAVRDACSALMIAHGLSQAQAAREIGVSGTRLSQWLSDQYRGDVAVTTALVQRWIDTRKDLSQRRLHAAGLDRHAKTAAWHEVNAALAYAQATGDLALVVGPPGRGKTWGSQRYCRDASGAAYLRVTPAVRSLAGLLARVAQALGCAPGASAIATESAVVAALEGRGALLVIDEAHHLGVSLLDELRCLRDLAGAGVALVADEPLMLTLPRCPQVGGRIGMEADLRRAHPADAVAVAEAVLARKLEGRERKMVQGAARTARGLHAVRQLLARAWVLAQGDEREDVTPEDLAGAMEESIEGGGVA